MIYGYVLSNHVITLFSLSDEAPEVSHIDGSHAGYTLYRLLAITSTCRQAHAESASMIFSTHFFTHDCKNSFEGLKTTVECLTEFQLKAVKYVEIHICDLECFSTNQEVWNVFSALKGLEKLTICESEEVDDIWEDWEATTQKLVEKRVGRRVHIELIDGGEYAEEECDKH